MADFHPSLEKFEEMLPQTGKMEVCGRWLSRNGRVQLTEVTESWSKKRKIEATVIWESVQDPKGHFDLLKLEEAMKEAQEDLKALRSYEDEGLTGEKFYLHPYRFHYYPDEDILRLTLEMLGVQRKEMLLRNLERVRSSRRTAGYAQQVRPQDQEEGWSHQPETIRSSPEARCLGLSLEKPKKMESLSGKKRRMRSLFCLCGKKKEK